jgi:hypothetical protein
VEKELTGRKTKPHEIIYFKTYKSQTPVVEQALETAAVMLGMDKSRGYCLVMICADFLAGANLENTNLEILLQSIMRTFKFVPASINELADRWPDLHHEAADPTCLALRSH